MSLWNRVRIVETLILILLIQEQVRYLYFKSGARIHIDESRVFRSNWASYLPDSGDIWIDDYKDSWSLTSTSAVLRGRQDLHLIGWFSVYYTYDDYIAAGSNSTRRRRLHLSTPPSDLHFPVTVRSFRWNIIRLGSALTPLTIQITNKDSQRQESRKDGALERGEFVGHKESESDFLPLLEARIPQYSFCGKVRAASQEISETRKSNNYGRQQFQINTTRGWQSNERWLPYFKVEHRACTCVQTAPNLAILCRVENKQWTRIFFEGP